MNSTVEQRGRDHERKDVDVVSLFMIVLMLFLACGLISLAIAILMRYFNLREPPKTAGRANIPATRAEEFPAPRLEVKPGASLAELHAAEDVDLRSYGWIDRDAGIVRIPIERAMQLIIERGLPNVGAGQTPLSLMQPRPVETASPPRLMEKR